MIAREMTTADEVFASAKRLKGVFFPSRQVTPTRVLPAAETVADEPIVAQETRQDRDGFQKFGDVNPSAEVDAAALLANFKRLNLSRIYGLADADALNPLTMAEIRDEVMLEFRISRMELLSERRHKNIVQPRQALMYLLRKYTTHSFPAIGRFCGSKDHTTVLHGDRRCQRRMTEEPAYREKVEAIEARLQKGRAVQ